MKIFFVFIFTFTFTLTFSQSIKINEVSSSNTIFFDDDGDTPDWIELHNATSNQISLNNWSLSDEEEDSNPWTFPDFSINPNEYLVVWASGKDISDIFYARTIINQGDAYRYVIADQNTDLNWYSPSFDDSQWSIGQSGFGYSDNDDNTIIPNGTISVFLRKTFTVDAISEINNLILDIDYDDGFVAYINGVEVARANINGTPPLHDTTTQIDHEAQIYNGGLPDRFSIENVNQLLVNGENTFAVQVHNISETSSDMTIIPFLSAIYSNQPNEGIIPPSILGLGSETFLHTDFKISSSGESIFLRDPDGNLVDSVNVPSLAANISYGISVNSQDFKVFDEPTPGYENDVDEFEGVLNNSLTFSHDGGILNSSIMLEIFGQENEEIRYTTDFTEPDEESELYTGPILIDQTMIIRAKGFKNNYISLHSKTRNYFFDIQSDLPIIHLVSDEYNLFDYDYGIYAYGPEDYGGYPYFGANFWEDWERPVHISYYLNNNLEFTSNAGMKIFGAYSRGWDQKSIALYARGEYGAGEFEFPFFDGLNYDTFESLVLRNSGNDWLRTNLRDAAITSLMEGSHIDYQSFKTVSSYINDSYWGLYNLREKVSENFVASKHDVNPNQIDMLTNNAEIVDGDNQEFLALREFIDQNDLSQPQIYNSVINQIDIDNFMEYHIAQIYMDNRDYPGNNVKFWKHPSTKWRWILYDTDFGFAGQWWSEWDQYYAHTYNTLEFAIEPNGPGWPNPPWSTLFLRKLLDNNDFKNKFINRYADEMNSRYLPVNVTGHFLAIYNNMFNEMLLHIDRWNESEPWVTVNTVYQFVDNMNNFAANRQPEAKSHILEEFDLSEYNEVVLFNDTPFAGYVLVNDNLKIQENEWVGDYFMDVPITLRAVAESGYEFSHWSGFVDSTSDEIEVNITDYAEIYAHFINSSDLNIVINEINYNSADDMDSGDWIELYNPNLYDIDISGWILKDDNDSNQYVFQDGQLIAGDDYLVIVKNSDDFSAAFPNLDDFVGEFDFGLSSSGDAVRLFNSDLIIQDEVYYDSSNPWPELANGGGYTLELIQPSLDNLLAENWNNINQYGSPDEINSATASVIENNSIFTKIYPNPFVNNLYLLFELDNQDHTKINLYDIKGSLVSEIFDGELSSGIHRLNRNFDYLNSGIYILKIITSSGKVQTEKLIKF